MNAPAVLQKGGENMNKKEVMDLMLSKVEESKKEAFVQEFREAKTKEERMDVIRKYGATLTEEEAEKLKGREGNAVGDAELDGAAGGCDCVCKCHCQCYCK